MLGHRNDENFKDIYTKQSVVLLSTRYIIQAIGRICRTNQKNKDIYIYADNNIVDRIDVSVINGRSSENCCKFLEPGNCLKEMVGQHHFRQMIIL